MTGSPPLRQIKTQSFPKRGQRGQHGQQQRGKPGKAFRRLRWKGTTWRDVTVRYPSIGAMRRTFAPLFHFRRASALGAILPPTYANEWATRHQPFIQFLNGLERRIETWPPVIWFGDHYVIELERR